MKNTNYNLGEYISTEKGNLVIKKIHFDKIQISAAKELAKRIKNEK